MTVSICLMQTKGKIPKHQRINLDLNKLFFSSLRPSLRWKLKSPDLGLVNDLFILLPPPQRFCVPPMSVGEEARPGPEKVKLKRSNHLPYDFQLFFPMKSGSGTGRRWNFPGWAAFWPSG